jgi:hypothetical protein
VCLPDPKRKNLLLRVLGRDPTRRSKEGPAALGKVVSLGLTFTSTFWDSTKEGKSRLVPLSDNGMKDLEVGHHKSIADPRSRLSD